MKKTIERQLDSVNGKLDELTRKKTCKLNFTSLTLPETEEEKELLANYLMENYEDKTASEREKSFNKIYGKMSRYESEIEKTKSLFRGQQPFLEKEFQAFYNFQGIILRTDRNFTSAQLERVYEREERLERYGARRSEREIHSAYRVRIRHSLLELMIERSELPKTQANEEMIGYLLKASYLDNRIEEYGVLQNELPVVSRDTLLRKSEYIKRRQRLIAQNSGKAAK